MFPKKVAVIKEIRKDAGLIKQRAQGQHEHHHGVGTQHSEGFFSVF